MEVIKHKLTIYVYHQTLEIHGDYDYLRDLWVKWANMRYKKGKPMGGSVLERVDRLEYLHAIGVTYD